jgi:hypothetical protein
MAKAASSAVEAKILLIMQIQSEIPQHLHRSFRHIKQYTTYLSFSRVTACSAKIARCRAPDMGTQFLPHGTRRKQDVTLKSCLGGILYICCYSKQQPILMDSYSMQKKPVGNTCHWHNRNNQLMHLNHLFSPVHNSCSILSLSSI